VKKQLAFVVAGLLAVLVLAGQLARASAGPGPDDPQDSLPAWSSNGVDIAFERTASTLAARVFDMAAGGKSIHAVQDGTLRGWVPGTEHLLVQIDGEHTVVQGDSSKDRPLAEFLGTDATASPDGQHVAYLRGGTLYVAAINGTGEHAIATGVTPPASDVTGPVWSPNGSAIAVASGTALLLVQADGSGQKVLIDGPGANDNPSWSPDSTTVAFEHDTGTHWQIWVTIPSCNFCLRALTGSANSRFPQYSPLSNTLALISDRQHAIGGATPYQYALYTQQASGGVARKLVDDVHPYSPPRWSPTAALIAVSAGQECLRWGIYVTRPDVGSQPHRRSNICRFDGTAHADVIQGSPYFDRINGLGGNDTLYGYAGSDKISGNGGNDTIYGGAGNDFILAGPGNDRIFGGPGNDTIIGGNGVDRIDCGPGNDTVEAAGPLDIIARNCEHIRH
jgi:Ca2+-binding RTX toxin-like protein